MKSLLILCWPSTNIWGIVGSGLTSGSPLGRRTSEIPDPETENPEKPEKLFPARFALLRLNQGTYRHGRGIHGSGLTWGSRWCHWKSGNPDPDRARAGKPVFPFCPIVAQPGHLQTSTGYLRIGLDLRITTVLKNLDFHFRIGRKIRKTEKPEKSKFEFDQPSANYCCWSYLPTFARCAVPLELPLFFCWASHGYDIMEKEVSQKMILACGG